MNNRVTDVTALATQVWLLEPEVARFLLAQAAAGTLTLVDDDVPIVYGYDDWGWFPAAERAGSTAVMTISGVLDSYAARYYINQLTKIFADANVSSLIVKVNGPGGLANAGSKVAQALRDAPIPTLAWVDFGTAASAHYMIACSCQAVWASRANDQIGSIGTYGTYQDWTKYYEKMGVVTKDLYAEQSTEKNAESIEARKGNFQPLIDRMTAEAASFITYVETQRDGKLTYTETNDPFKGRLFMASDALAIGLIDQIGSLPEAITAVRALVTSSSTPDTMFGFMKSAAFDAVKGVASADITEAQLTAMNEQLKAYGLDNVLVVSSAQMELAIAQATEITTLKSQINTLTATETTLKAEVARLGTQPGEKPTAPVKTDAQVQAETISVAGDTLTPQQMIDNLPHNKAADQAGFGY